MAAAMNAPYGSANVMIVLPKNIAGPSASGARANIVINSSKPPG
jgi:hypothetical protein